MGNPPVQRARSSAEKRNKPCTALRKASTTSKRRVVRGDGDAGEARRAKEGEALDGVSKTPPTPRATPA
eukprot:10543934-Alexandrium_andersonii.AAC.1